MQTINFTINEIGAETSHDIQCVHRKSFYFN